MDKLKSFFSGASGDSFFLMFVRMVTLVFGLLMTRMLSGHFSLQDYGTYSQVMLITTTVSSLTIMGMMDGINFFFCKEKEKIKRDQYISTIFFLQYVIAAIAAIIVLACAIPISKYFDNANLKSLIIFAACLPVLQNMTSLLQIMFVAIGKAKVIAIRNLIVSVVKLGAVLGACYIFNSLVALLLCQLLMEFLQVVYFRVSLHKKKYEIKIFKFNKSLIKEILNYCIPMGLFSILKSLNREADKFVISFFTNTETLAVYTNASKILPFDVVMTALCTVLLPYITKYISSGQYDKVQALYKVFLEVSYVSTAILAIGAICVAPELMRFLYTEKYSRYDYGISVFIIYTIVDILSVLNITLILSAAGKAKMIMFTSVGTFFANIILNIVCYFGWQEIGPAIATLFVSFVQGIILLSLSAKELKFHIVDFFNIKYMLLFLGETVCFFTLAFLLRRYALNKNLHYLVVLFLCFFAFAIPMFVLNCRRLLKNLTEINTHKLR